MLEVIRRTFPTLKHIVLLTYLQHLVIIIFCPISGRKMLKWAVYSKKNNDGAKGSDPEVTEQITDEPFRNKPNRRSLDTTAVKKNKKPSRYQRRSLGSTTKKNSLKSVDKENINYIGNTPNYFKEGFLKKPDGLALKDVSNITPTSTTPTQRRRFFINGSKDDVPPDLPPTPPTYSRRVREAKKRKLEMASCNTNHSFIRNSSTTKSERHMKSPDIKKSLCHSNSLNDISDRLSDTLKNQRNSLVIAAKQNRSQTISTTKPISEGLVEIEYDEDIVIKCIEKPIPVTRDSKEMTTLPIFGHQIFMENPLYFNQNELAPTNLMPFKRTRRKSSEFESSFKSPSVDKKNVHTLLRDGCSPVSMTPLSVKLSALRFSAMSTHNKSQRTKFNPEISEYLPRVENPFLIPMKDEELSAEMENKFILSKDSFTNVTGSTISTTQMGDTTLDRMIEDIIKSTKIVKTRRRILNEGSKSPVNVEATSEEAKDLFVNSLAHHKGNIIKEARYVNLSRNNSMSPKSSPVKKINPVRKVNEKLLKNLPIGCFILDDGDGYNEREVRTPEHFVDQQQKVEATERRNITLSRSKSMNTNSTERGNLEYMSSESTPDLFSAAKEEAHIRLRRQRCIRRKKSTVSNESWKQKRADTKSILTLDINLPSPAINLPNVSLGEPPTICQNYLTKPLTVEIPEFENSFLYAPNSSFHSNVSTSSMMNDSMRDKNKRSRDLFGLTLDNGIPSPITPVTNLKRPSGRLSEERAHKTSKLDEDLLSVDAYTPVIEHKSSRRCLTYSPEEGSISSEEEKRRSVASNRFDRSCDRFQLKGTIDLEIITRNDIIDVHGEWYLSEHLI